MRRAAVFLALLLCLLWTGAQGEDGGGTGKKEGGFDIQGVKAAHDQSSSQTQMSTDVWAELKEIRDMAIEHRIKIQRLEQDNTGDTPDVKHTESHITLHWHAIIITDTNDILDLDTQLLFVKVFLLGQAPG